jgi:type II secretory pathway pseudopilin PulG
MRLLFPRRCGTHSRQRGYVLLVILLMLVFAMLALLSTAPAIAQQIRREREEELIRRGRQYAVAIKRFYKKFGRYPTTLEELENSNRMRFLRRRFKDPMTESGEWRLIRFGEVKTTPTGLFGKPLTAGVPAAALGTPASSLGTNPGTGTPGSPAGQERSSGGSRSDSLSGRVFGGGPIVGVASTSEAESIKTLNGKNRYNDWEFFYDPRFDVGPGGAAGLPQQQPGQPGTNPQQQNPGGLQNVNPGTPR